MQPPLRTPLRVIAILWALPTTLVGLFLLAIALVTGGRAALVDAVLEAHGGCVGWVMRRMSPGRGGWAAVTLGHVVLGTDPSALLRTRAHERAHVAQCERWGPFFLPAYALASLWALTSGADPYRDNWFEREAFAVANPTEGNRPRPASRDAAPRSM